MTEANAIVAAKRRERDINKLIMSNHQIERSLDNPSEFTIKFHGPQDSLYEGGNWTLRCFLPDTYPFKSPSLGFLNKMFHPNVDLKSGLSRLFNFPDLQIMIINYFLKIKIFKICRFF